MSVTRKMKRAAAEMQVDVLLKQNKELRTSNHDLKEMLNKLLEEAKNNDVPKTESIISESSNITNES